MKRIDCSPEIIKDDRSPTGYFVTFRYQWSDGQKKTADKKNKPACIDIPGFVCSAFYNAGCACLYG